MTSDGRPSFENNWQASASAGSLPPRFTKGVFLFVRVEFVKQQTLTGTLNHRNIAAVRERHAFVCRLVHLRQVFRLLHQSTASGDSDPYRSAEGGGGSFTRALHRLAPIETDRTPVIRKLFATREATDAFRNN